MLNKRLGQHFLINKKIVAEIIGAGELSKGNIVLEVGPGRGVLTEALAQKAKKVIAVEKDVGLVEYLKEKFSKYRNIEIVHDDILKTDTKNYGLKTVDYKLIANIPYYITSKFLRMFLSDKKLRPSLMVLMLQREVAERIVAKDGKESLLSLSVKAYGKPEIIKIVKRGNFFPPPKVDSAIIKITPTPLAFARGTPPYKGGETIPQFPPLTKGGREGVEQILSFARKAFQQKRKMLRHSLGKNIPEKYQNKRPEELKLEDWAVIYSSQSAKSPML